jgi:hypothetical protein
MPGVNDIKTTKDAIAARRFVDRERELATSVMERSNADALEKKMYENVLRLFISMGATNPWRIREIVLAVLPS